MKLLLLLAIFFLAPAPLPREVKPPPKTPIVHDIVGQWRLEIGNVKSTCRINSDGTWTNVDSRGQEWKGWWRLHGDDLHVYEETGTRGFGWIATLTGPRNGTKKDGTVFKLTPIKD